MSLFLLLLAGCPAPTGDPKLEEKEICVRNKLAEPLCYDLPRDEYIAPTASVRKPLF